jgi:hypothetical protein
MPRDLGDDDVALIAIDACRAIELDDDEFKWHNGARVTRAAFNACPGVGLQSLVNKIRERDAARLDGSSAVLRYIIQCATLARVSVSPLVRLSRAR